MKPQQQVARMAELLDGQLELYRGLTNMAVRKRELLMAGSVQDLERLLEAEQVLLWRAGRLDDERLGLQESISLELGLDSEATLQDLADRLDEPGHSRCQDLINGLNRVLIELAELNRNNRELIAGALEQIGDALDLIQSAARRHDGYGNGKGTRDEKRPATAVIDSRA